LIQRFREDLTGWALVKAASLSVAGAAPVRPTGYTHPPQNTLGWHALVSCALCSTEGWVGVRKPWDEARAARGAARASEWQLGSQRDPCIDVPQVLLLLSLCLLDHLLRRRERVQSCLQLAPATHPYWLRTVRAVVGAWLDTSPQASPTHAPRHGGPSVHNSSLSATPGPRSFRPGPSSWPFV
jgi:hypothetical protein